MTTLYYSRRGRLNPFLQHSIAGDKNIAHQLGLMTQIKWNTFHVSFLKISAPNSGYILRNWWIYPTKSSTWNENRMNPCCDDVTCRSRGGATMRSKGWLALMTVRQLKLLQQSLLWTGTFYFIAFVLSLNSFVVKKKKVYQNCLLPSPKR